MSAIHVVVMGVSGCGKSAVGRRIAEDLGLPFIEGDEFHPERNIDKMRRGLPLDDHDRGSWLERLARELQKFPSGAVLTCSALKRSYRNTLRAAAPDLCFVHLALSEEQALERVTARGGHFYPPSLVASQFEDLQDPLGEGGVLTIDATLPLVDVSRQATGWIRKRAQPFNNA